MEVDGRPVKHPIFKLALQTTKSQGMAQAQGRASIGLAGYDPNVTVNEIRAAKNDSELAKATSSLITRAMHHAGNIPGNKQYMQAQFRQMLASNFVRSHKHNERPNLFHTGSQAEYHDFFLRRMLCAYVSNLDIDTDLHHQIMTDDVKFAEAVQSYLQVTTHFFAAKMEIWLAYVMKEVHGVTDVVGAMEFAEGRGAIHFHLLCRMMNPAVELWEPALAIMAGVFPCFRLNFFCSHQLGACSTLLYFLIFLITVIFKTSGPPAPLSH